MRIVVRQCATPTNHRIHVQSGRSPHGEPTKYLCGGDALGDKRIRQADNLAALVREIEDPLAVAFERLTGGVPLDAYPHHTTEPVDAPDDDAGGQASDADVAASRYFNER